MATEVVTTVFTQPHREQGPGTSAGVEVASGRLARLGDRFLGLLIDALPLLGLSVVLTAYFARMKDRVLLGFTVPSAPSWLPYLFFCALSFFYYSLLEGACGFTLGKALVGIRVRNMNGEECDMRASLIRNLFRLIDGLAGYLLAFLVASFSGSRQRVGDHLANTVVVERDLPTRWRLLVTTLWTVLTLLAGYGAYVVRS